MSGVADVIRRELGRVGVIRFDRFMELALYHPAGGYYEREEPITGRRGDFFTSVSVGSLFGELLGYRLARWLEELGPEPTRLVEAGAHDGRLAGDILGYLRRYEPALFARMEYWLVEPSARRRGWQAGRLAEFGDRVRWFDDLARIPRGSVGGVVLGNELLDAMPIRRFSWKASAQTWGEWGVVLAGEGFAWQRMEVDAASAAAAGVRLPAELVAVLPDGYVVETSPAALAWWRAAAGILARGRLVAIDYGWAAAEQGLPERPAGTLRGYRRHRNVADVLADPGEQDLTAHVDFEALQGAGEAAGLVTAALTPQGIFLSTILRELESALDRFPEWTPARRRQFVTLTHPQHLGRAFRVLVQTRVP